MPHPWFSGEWVFCEARSTLSTPPPVRWIQHIKVEDTQVTVREEIVRDTGTTVQTIHAKADGHFHPITGSSIVDEIAYQIEGLIITGTGRKNGVESLRETLVFSPAGGMEMTYSIFANGREVASGIAAFERAP